MSGDPIRMDQSAGVNPGLAAHYAPLVTLVEKAVDARVRVALMESVAEIRTAMETLAAANQQAGATDPGRVLVRGIDPNALYSRETVARRWGLSSETVRKIAAEELPTAVWCGASVRYRGSDVLRYEQAPDDRAVTTPMTRAGDNRGRSGPSRTRTGRRPKSGHLPRL
jgi:hypothetical protein